MPAHHTGFARYASRSEARPSACEAAIRPWHQGCAHTFFVMIKLVPIAALELMASMSPIHLSWLSDVIARRHLRCDRRSTSASTRGPPPTLHHDAPWRTRRPALRGRRASRRVGCASYARPTRYGPCMGRWRSRPRVRCVQSQQGDSVARAAGRAQDVDPRGTFAALTA